MKKIEVFTRDACAFCDQAKNLLKQQDIAFVEYNIWQDTAAADDMKKRVPNARSVPQIFIDGESIGGYNELEKLHRDGKLSSMVE